METSAARLPPVSAKQGGFVAVAADLRHLSALPTSTGMAPAKPAFHSPTRDPTTALERRLMAG